VLATLNGSSSHVQKKCGVMLRTEHFSFLFADNFEASYVDIDSAVLCILAYTAV
jgi:hypothetical protein